MALPPARQAGEPSLPLRRGYTRCGPEPGGSDVLEAELEQLEQRVQRLVAAYRQAKLETKRALQERDRLTALNAELRRRIEGVVERVRKLETEQGSEENV